VKTTLLGQVQDTADHLNGSVTAVTVLSKCASVASYC
jgi:hypothetical protein